ncbi:cysteine ABC transporter permease, partial [Escherichia coli]|nr:cysteine ABC transporter permease [Escherichia coli]
MTWLLDIPGAALFAAGIALAVSSLAAGEGLPWGAVALILAGGAIRAGAAILAHAVA